MLLHWQEMAFGPAEVGFRHLVTALDGGSPQVTPPERTHVVTVDSVSSASHHAETKLGRNIPRALDGTPMHAVPL